MLKTQTTKEKTEDISIHNSNTCYYLLSIALCPTEGQELYWYFLLKPIYKCRQGLRGSKRYTKNSKWLSWDWNPPTLTGRTNSRAPAPALI